MVQWQDFWRINHSMCLKLTWDWLMALEELCIFPPWIHLFKVPRLRQKSSWCPNSHPTGTPCIICMVLLSTSIILWNTNPWVTTSYSKSCKVHTLSRECESRNRSKITKRYANPAGVAPGCSYKVLFEQKHPAKNIQPICIFIKHEDSNDWTTPAKNHPINWFLYIDFQPPFKIL